MGTGKRIYHRTEAGEQALKRSDRRLAGEDRAILALIGDGRTFDPKPELLRSLDALESCGFVESVSVEWLWELYRLGCYDPTPLKRRTPCAGSSYKAQ